MSNAIKVKRGEESTIPTLAAGEPAFTTDTYKLYVGDGAVNHLIGGGGGSGVVMSSQAMVDFGYSGGSEGDIAVVTVSAPWIKATSITTCSPACCVTADHDAKDAAVEGIQAYATNVIPDTSFDVVACAPQGSWGRYLVNCITVIN